MTTTRAIRIHENGGPEAMKLEDAELTPPGPSEVRIRHTAIGVNFVDVYFRTGLYKAELPTGLGSEAAGVIEAIGAEVSGFAVGDRVGYNSGPLGAYAAARNFPAARLVKLPSYVTDEMAAAGLLKGMTVEYLIRRTFRVQAGQTVLFHAAAGGVGLIACQWLRALGATVIGTVSSDEKAELARAHGAHHTIVYTREDVVQRVRDLTGGKGVAVAYDSIGKDTLLGSIDCLARRGMAVAFGNASGRPPAIDPLTLSAKGSLYLTRATLAHYIESREDLDESARSLFEVIQSGAVKIDVRQRYPLAEVGLAHTALEARATMGSTILIPST